MEVWCRKLACALLSSRRENWWCRLQWIAGALECYIEPGHHWQQQLASYSVRLCLLQEWAKNTMAGRMSKSDKLGAVDHSKIDYPPFRRNFYIEVQELQKMSEEDVAKYRKELDDIKVSHQACLAGTLVLL